MEGQREQIAAGGPGFFVTREVWREIDGEVHELESRWQRKHSPRFNPRGGSTPAGRPAVFWAPRRVTWWVGLLFMIGATNFAVPSVPSLAAAMGVQAAAIVYFVGSLFFTSAGYLQYFESINAGREVATGDPGAPRPRLVFLAWQPRRIDFWATGVQFAGTLLFNINTVHALDVALSGRSYDVAVWRPDAAGSICFLVASYLAWAEVCHSFRHLGARGRRDLSWAIAVINMLGSIAFGLSAVGAWQSAGGAAVSAALASWGTFAGAVCFFVAAFLLWPEAGRESRAPSAPVAGQAAAR